MTKEAAPSQNELIAAHIERQRSEGVDFSTASARRASIQNFCDQYPKANPASVAAAHKTQLAKLAKKWGADPGQFKAASRGKKKFDSTMNANIREKPADINDQGSGGGSSFRAGGAGPGRPQGGAAQGQGRAPREARPERYSPKTAGHIVNSAYNVVAGGRKEARPLPPDVVESMGEVWAGPLNYYLYDYPHAELIIAALATLTVFARYAGIGRKKKKPEPERADVVEEEEEEEPTEELNEEEKMAKARSQFGDAAKSGSDY